MLDAEQSEIAIPNSSCVQRGSEFEETNLSEEIAALWSAHHEGKAAAKRTNAELKILRRTLGERLWEMKLLLARSGRGGQWTSYLREHHISRATADRYVLLHEKTLTPPQTKRLNEAISTTTEEDDVHLLFEKLLPKLRSILRTQESAFLFVCDLVCGLPGIQGDVTDTGAEIFRPPEEPVSALSNGADVPQVPVAVC